MALGGRSGRPGGTCAARLDECCYPAPVTDDAADTVTSATPAPRRRYVPAILDAIIPGLGHVVAGRRLLGAIFLTPTILALLAAAYIAMTTSGPRLVATLLESEVIWGLLAFQGGLLLWRLLAVGSSLFARGLPRIVEFHRNRDLYMRKHHSRPAALAVRALTAWSYALRALAATVLPGQPADVYRAHARQALFPSRGKGLRP